MTNDEREALIEEVAKAMVARSWGLGTMESARADAEIALAVFEQASTRTDDERTPGFAEREKRAARAWEFFARDDREMSHDFRGGYHQGMIDGFRRPVTVPSVVVSDGSVRVSEDERACASAHGELSGVPGQLEPTDAGVARAALRAAFQEGENR